MAIKFLGKIEITDDELLEVVYEERIFVIKNAVLGIDSCIDIHNDFHLGLFDTRKLQHEEMAELINALHQTPFPSIILRSSADSYHIIFPYSHKRHELYELASILCDYIDPVHFGLGCQRGFWTLRLTSKNEKKAPEFYSTVHPQGNLPLAHKGLITLLELSLNRRLSDSFPVNDNTTLYLRTYGI